MILDGQILVRNDAIIALYMECEINRQAIVELNMKDIDVNERTIRIRFPKHTEKTTVRIPSDCMIQVSDWKTVRKVRDNAKANDPLFVNMDNANKTQRLSPTSLSRIVYLEKKRNELI